jgi:hypothetical protein
VELSAIGEASQLNRNGLYKIGSNTNSRGTANSYFNQTPTPESLISLETVLETESIVEAKASSTQMTKSLTSVDKKIIKNKQHKKYNYEKLNELKSVLMLVARKNADNVTFDSSSMIDERVENEVNEMENLDYFIEVFDNIVILAEILLRLVESGCWMFENAVIKVNCDIKNELKASKKLPVEIELSPKCSGLSDLFSQNNNCLIRAVSNENSTIELLKEMCRFLEDSLKAWLKHVESVRDEYSLVNFFTIKQIMYLKSYFTSRIFGSAHSTEIRLDQIQSLLFNLHDKLDNDFIVEMYKLSFMKFDLRTKKGNLKLAKSSAKTNEHEEYIKKFASDNGFKISVVREAVAKYGGAQNEDDIYAYCFENNDANNMAVSLDVQMDGVETADDSESKNLEFSITIQKGNLNETDNCIVSISFNIKLF